MESRKRIIDITPLYQLVENAERVDGWDLTRACEELYRSVKIVGINRTNCVYEKNTVISGMELPTLMKEVAIQVVRRIYRWDDLESGRLEEHFGIPTNSYHILYPYNIMEMYGVKYVCMTVDQLIDNFVEQRRMMLGK